MANFQPPTSTTSLALLTSANGTVRNGSTFAISTAAPGLATVLAACTIVTGSVTATFAFQVSADGTTFVNLTDAAGTAVAPALAATGSIAIPVPLAAWTWPYFRVNATLAGAATAAGDKSSVVIRFQTYPAPQW